MEQGSRNRRYFVREFVRTYMNFYETMSGATGNIVYLHLGNTFLEVLAEALPYPDKLFLVQPDISTVLYLQHLAIWEAVRDHDPAGGHGRLRAAPGVRRGEAADDIGGGEPAGSGYEPEQRG